MHNAYNPMLIGGFCSSTVFRRGYFMSMPDLQHPATTGGRAGQTLLQRQRVYPRLCLLNFMFNLT